MGDEHDGALEVLERRLELHDRLQIEVVGRLVEDEAFTPRAARSASVARLRSPGESERAGAPDVICAERELGEKRSGRADFETRRVEEEIEQRAAPRRRRLRLAEARRARRRDRPSAGPPPAGARREAPCKSVVLPAPFRPRTTSRSPFRRSRSIGPSRKPSRSIDRSVEPRDDVAGPPGRRERELEPPGGPRLLDLLDLGELLLEPLGDVLGLLLLSALPVPALLPLPHLPSLLRIRPRSST